MYHKESSRFGRCLLDWTKDRRMDAMMKPYAIRAVCVLFVWCIRLLQSTNETRQKIISKFFNNHHFAGSALAGRGCCLLSLLRFVCYRKQNACPPNSNGFRALWVMVLWHRLRFMWCAHVHLHRTSAIFVCYLPAAVRLCRCVQREAMSLLRENMFTLIWSMTITLENAALCRNPPSRNCKKECK